MQNPDENSNNSLFLVKFYNDYNLANKFEIKTDQDKNTESDNSEDLDIFVKEQVFLYITSLQEYEIKNYINNDSFKQEVVKEEVREVVKPNEELPIKLKKIDLIKIFQTRIDPIIKFSFLSIIVNPTISIDIQTLGNNLEFLSFNFFNSLLQQKILELHIIQTRLEAERLTNNQQTSLTSTYVELSELIPIFNYILPINYLYDSLPTYWFESNNIKKTNKFFLKKHWIIIYSIH